MIKFEWDGEKVREVHKVEDKKHSTKDILVGLDHVRNQICQMKDQASNLVKQVEANEKNLNDAKVFEKELGAFEEKCVELQKEKLLLFISQLSVECKAKALKSSKETIDKDPSAYNEDQRKNLPYLDYQKLLATNGKVAERIAPRIIRDFLYDTPVFDNPFKE